MLKLTSAELADFHQFLQSNLGQTLEKLRDHTGTIVLNADDLFKLHPRYRDDVDARGILGPQLYPIARDFTDAAFAWLLSQPISEKKTIIFTAGGGASGKSTVLRALANKNGVDFVVDTTFSSPDRALKQIEDALSAGRRVEVNYVFRPFDDSVRGMLLRACDRSVGRVVPIDDLARTHAGSQESIIALFEKYSSENRLEIRLWENTGPRTVERISREKFAACLHPFLDELQKRGQHILNEIYRGNDSEWQGGQISSDLYEASRSRVQGRE